MNLIDIDSFNIAELQNLTFRQLDLDMHELLEQVKDDPKISTIFIEKLRKLCSESE